MQEGKDVKMKLFPRVLPVDIPLRSLSITDSANISKAKLMRKKKSLKPAGPVVPFYIQCST